MLLHVDLGKNSVFKCTWVSDFQQFIASLGKYSELWNVSILKGGFGNNVMVYNLHGLLYRNLCNIYYMILLS